MIRVVNTRDEYRIKNVRVSLELPELKSTQSPVLMTSGGRVKFYASSHVEESPNGEPIFIGYGPSYNNSISRCPTREIRVVFGE